MPLPQRRGAEVPSPGNEAVDLSLIRAPIPQLLAERAAPAVEKPVAVEVAALPEPDQIRARMLAGAEPVVAVQTAEPTEVASRTLVSGDAIVSEPVLAKLPSGEDFVPLPIRRPGDRPADRVADRPAQVEMAALVPVERGRRPVAATTVSSKGNRPNAASAADQPQRTAIRTEPKLTETIISNWALTRERVKTMPTPPASARRFVVSQLRAAPKVVYANGFAPNGRELPHNQFTGSAVNFISVARFGN
jgi:type IV secretory pathway VirJ component